MKNLIIIGVILIFQNIFCFNQITLNIYGKDYTISEISDLYYVNIQESNFIIKMNSKDQKRLSSCDMGVSSFLGKTEVLEKCQKDKINSSSEKQCRYLTKIVHTLIWESPFEKDRDRATAEWSIENDVASIKGTPEELILIEKIATMLNVPKNKIIIYKEEGGLQVGYNGLDWKYIRIKKNPYFDLVKNFYYYADQYEQSSKIELSAQTFRTFDNITRCSLLMNESELRAETEYKIKVPGEIDPTTRNNLEHLLRAYREIKIDSFKNGVKKLLIIGAYMGYTFQENLFSPDHESINNITAIFSSLFDTNIQLRESINYDVYRKLMNIQPTEISIPIRLKAVVSQ